MANMGNASICLANSNDGNTSTADECAQKGNLVFQQKSAERYLKHRLAEFAACSAVAVC